MVQIFSPKKRPQKQTPKALALTIDTLDHEGVGICRSHKPVVFVEGGLPGEQCQVRVTEQKKQHWRGNVSKVLAAASERVTPFCPHFQQCGGCQNQHAEPAFMLETKQQAVDGLLKRVGGLPDIPWHNPIVGNEQGYRRKARLAVDAQKPGQVKLGFRGDGSRAVVNIEQCQVLVPQLQALIMPLQQVVGQMKNPRSLGHITLIAADSEVLVVLRVVRPLTSQDHRAFSTLMAEHHCRVIAEHNDNNFEALDGDDVAPQYVLDQVSIGFQPNDFIQVNGTVNQAMVAQAMSWLNIQPQDNVLDLFCGVGNFSLPMAKQCQKVIGIEGVADMVIRAKANARMNQLSNAEFIALDLNQPGSMQRPALKACNKVLLDPARAGALEVMPQLAALKPEAILYVSCNPATFARDAGVLVEQGYQLDRIALLDMFPFTRHCELMALFLPA